jgi:hypothetical protein
LHLNFDEVLLPPLGKDLPPYPVALIIWDPIQPHEVEVVFTSCGLFKPIIDPFWSHGLWSDHSSNAFLCVLLLESRMFSASKHPPYVS